MYIPKLAPWIVIWYIPNYIIYSSIIIIKKSSSQLMIQQQTPTDINIYYDDRGLLDTGIDKIYCQGSVSVWSSKTRYLSWVDTSCQ